MRINEENGESRKQWKKNRLRDNSKRQNENTQQNGKQTPIKKKLFNLAPSMYKIQMTCKHIYAHADIKDR